MDCLIAMGQSFYFSMDVNYVPKKEKPVLGTQSTFRKRMVSNYFTYLKEKNAKQVRKYLFDSP